MPLYRRRPSPPEIVEAELYESSASEPPPLFAEWKKRQGDNGWVLFGPCYFVRERDSYAITVMSVVDLETMFEPVKEDKPGLAGS